MKIKQMKKCREKINEEGLNLDDFIIYSLNGGGDEAAR